MAYTNFTNCTKEQYESIIYSEEDTNRIRIWFNNIELEDADEYCESFSGTNRILPDDGNKIFTLDNFIAKEYELVLKRLPETVVVEDQVKISIGTLVDNTDEENPIYEDVPIGIFNIQDKPETDQEKITIKLRDNRVKFDFNYDAQPLIESLGGTATKKQILEDICHQAGVENLISTFEGEDDEVSIYDNTTTATTYITYILEQAGLMPTINRNGQLDKINFNDLKVWRIPVSIIEKYELGTPFEIQRVVYETGITKYESGESETLDTLYINSANPYINDQQQIDNIYNMLKGFSLDSAKTGKILGNPAIDPFDIIEIYDDEVDSSPIITGTGTTVNLENTVEKQMKIKLEPSAIAQNGTPSITNPVPVQTIKGSNKIVITGSEPSQSQTCEINLGKNLMNTSYLATRDVTIQNEKENDFIYENYWANEMINNADVLKIFEPNTQYTISFKFKILERPNTFGTYNHTNLFNFYNGTQSYWIGNNNKNAGDLDTWYEMQFSLTTPASLTNYRLLAYTFKDESNNTVGIIEIKDFQIEKGSATDFAPYFEPIEYCAIGDNKDKFIKTTGKNLVDVSQIQLKKKWNNEDANNYASILYIPIEKNKQYTLVAFWAYSRIASTFSGYLNNGPDDTENYERINGSGSGSTIDEDITFNSGNWSYISISFSSNYAWTDSYLKGLNVMLCKGEATVDDYEPYGMNKWYLKKQVDSVVLDGTEPATFQTNNIYRVYSYDLPVRLNNSWDGCKSNYFQYSTVSSNENSYQYATTYIRVRFNTSFTDLESMQSWLAEHKPIFYAPTYSDYYYSLPDSLEQELENVYKTLKAYNGQTNISQNNDNLPFQINVTAYNNSLILSTLANNTYKYSGVNINEFDTQIGLEQRTENVTINSEATLKRWAKTNIDNLQGQITLSVGDINDLEGRVNQTELDISSQSAKIEVLSTNIDEETGNVLGVKTTSYELGSNGFIIDDGTGYKSVDNTTGKYFYDNNSMVGKYTKDGSVQKNLALFGKYYYGVDENVDVEGFSKEDAMFVAEEYTGQDEEGNDETGFGHFYNGD